MKQRYPKHAKRDTDKFKLNKIAARWLAKAQMKSHKYWSIGALVSMIGTCYTGYKDMKSAHKYFAFSSLICMAMAIYSGHKMISGKSRKKKETAAEESAE